MHAARGNHVDAFTRARDLYQDHRHTLARPTDGGGDPGSFNKIDNTGRSVLHHAAEAGCLDVLTEVMKLSNDNMMHRPDMNGLTPVHHLLRAKYGEPEGRDELRSKFEKLWNDMEPRDVMPWTTPARAQDGIAVRAQTELIHAARGGLSTLRLVLDKTRATMQTVDDVRLDDALSVKVAEEKGEGKGPPPTMPQKSELAQWGWGMLLAAVTKGGHVQALEIVVRAIKVCISRENSTVTPVVWELLLCGGSVKTPIIRLRTSVF